MGANPARFLIRQSLVMTHTEEIRERINGILDGIFRLVPRTFTASQFITAFKNLDHEGYEFALQNANSYQDFNKWIGEHVLPRLEGSRIIRTNRMVEITTENEYQSRNTEWQLIP